MTSGGARYKSGPPADPNALRRDRKDDAEWVTLPAEGFTGVVPSFPLAEALTVEVELWDELWRKPQAVMWDRLGLKFQVAMYVRTFLEAATAGAVNGLKTAALRMEAELGLSMPAMNSLHWRFAEDELSARRDAVVVPVSDAPSAKDRWAALADEG